jgi:hypothetical protein
MQQNQKKKKQHARLLLSYQIGGATTMGVDHVGTMEQWEQRMATSMWRVSCVFLVLLLALPTTKIIL